jgi:hypothetical protein
MLSDEIQTDDVIESKENGVLPILKIEKNLQILFSNQTSQVILLLIMKLPSPDNFTIRGLIPVP